ncbi:MAG: dihydrofolate reductase [Henriciella sp.]|nr:dihydrofolate reductase [Henriciella sp.]
MKSSVKLSLIVARSRNGVIGHEGNLPWRLADDLAFFKSVTTGSAVIMGRRTWESLPKRPLPDRDNIVLSRDWTYQAEGARVFTAVAPALEAGKALARARGAKEAFVIGGAALYSSTISVADLLYITEVDAEIEGDVSFPRFDENQFDEITTQSFAASERNQYPFTLRVLRRKS